MPIGGTRPPRVAVVVGCYNQEAFVEAALRSVAAQRYEHFECVVLDDCSTDGSYQRIEQALQSLDDSRFRAVLRRANGGQMATMLEGLDATSGPFVAFLDADDLWHPEFLEQHVLAHMSPRALAAISCSNLAIIDAEGTQISGAMPNFLINDPRRKRGEFTDKHVSLDDDMRVFVAPGVPPGWIWSATSAMMFRRSVVDLLRPARPERFRISADHLLARGSHMLGGTVRIERSLGCYRLHDRNGFARNVPIGARSILGHTQKGIIQASREEIVRCLCDNAERLRTTLPPNYLASLLIELVGRDQAVALAAADPHAALILSGLSKAPLENRPRALKSLKRRLRDWFKTPSDTAPR